MVTILNRFINSEHGSSLQRMYNLYHTKQITQEIELIFS